MNLIRNHPEARWLPSRSHFAIFRLWSFLRLPKRPYDDELSTAYAIDRQQNGFENFAVATLVSVATFCYVSAVFNRWLPLPVAVIASVVLSPVIAQAPFFAMGLLIMPLWKRITGRESHNNVAANSFATMAVLIAASAWFVMRGGWPRIVGCGVLALFALNSIAAVAVRLLRGRIRDLEVRCGA